MICVCSNYSYIPHKWPQTISKLVLHPRCLFYENQLTRLQIDSYKICKLNLIIRQYACSINSEFLDFFRILRIWKIILSNSIFGYLNVFGFPRFLRYHFIHVFFYRLRNRLRGIMFEKTIISSGKLLKLAKEYNISKNVKSS